MNFSAAFDTLDHDMLLSVFHIQFCIASNALFWFDTYLCPRQFHVNVEGHKSSKKPLDFSLSPEKLWGPTLFTAYSRTLQYVIHQANRINRVGPDSEPVKSNNPILLNGFVDDYSLKNGLTPDAIQSGRIALVPLEISLKDISEWMSLNHFKMNSRKIEFMYFGSRVQLSKCKETVSKYVKMKLREAVTSIYWVHGWMNNCQ